MEQKISSVGWKISDILKTKNTVGPEHECPAEAREANKDRPVQISRFWGIRRKSALTFLFIGVVSWDLTRLRMRCKSLDFV